MNAGLGDSASGARAAGDEDGDDWLHRSVEAARRGVLLAYPTETSWGLGADATRPEALRALRRFKGDRGDKPFSILVSGVAALATLECRAGAAAREMAERFWPGPLTLVIPCLAPWATAVGRPDGGVAVRCSPHPVATALCAALEAGGLGPLTSTSLNRSGDPPAQRFDEAAAFCADGEVWMAAPLGAAAGGEPPSTIVDTTGAVPALLRQGALAREALSTWVPAS